MLSRRREIQQALAMQRDVIHDLAPSETRDALEQLQATKQQRADLREHRDQTLKRVDRSQTEIAEIAGKLEELDEQTERTTRQVAALKSQLKAEIESRTTTARLPRARGTFKSEIPIVVRYGRVYLPYRTSLDCFGSRINSEDVVVLREAGGELHATPKPYAGLSITASQAFGGALAAKLADYSADRFYIAVAIWDDSFDEFEALQRTLVELGYEYRLIPVPEGGSVTEGYVGDILVQ